MSVIYCPYMGITIELKKEKQKICVQMDAGRFERLAASFGFFNPEFEKSVERAEQDVRAGRVRKIRSLEDLRG